MRRAAPPLPISPKLLKHFAAVTVVLTACIAMFADGESREAIQEQVDMRAARNQLLETEAQKLGTRKLKSNLAAKDKNPSSAGFSDDGGMIDVTAGDVTVGEGGVGRQLPSAPRFGSRQARGTGTQQSRVPIPILPATPGASVTLRGVPDDGVSGPRVTSGNTSKRSASIRPSADQKARIKELAHERTGSAAGD
ncbi:hypothetical protein [Novosphingobium sp.]|uniref:hypothetical protein n=1 Tax=Novosphingobium sp. TaxID=1874826 RepID=UPI001ECBA9AA|nr:hypothetical protein [Novosphingobium sp.]MBK9010141.1 hypothetical protein [Novosphingobium sp.]